MRLRARVLTAAAVLSAVALATFAILPEVADSATELAPGETLLLYTDGLTEAAAPERTLTTADVERLLAGARGETAEQTAGACLDRALADGGGVVRDDVAVLVAQVPIAALDRRENSGRGIFDTGTMNP
jgi:serine/threonine protein phosphatase PrpC